MTVRATGSGGTNNIIGMLNSSVSSLRLYRVRLELGNLTIARGIRNVSSSPLIEECELTIAASGSGSESYGVVFRNPTFTSQRSSILRSRITVTGAANNYGVFTINSMTVNEIRDSRIDAVGGGTTYGLFSFAETWDVNETLSIRHSEISSAGGSSASYGAKLGGGSQVSLDVTGSKIWGHVAPQKYGIAQEGANTAMTFQGSNVLSDTKTIESLTGNVLVASTSLAGGPVSAGGWLGCVGVWDENAVFYANSCQP